MLSLLTMMSIWLVSGIFAKYTVNDHSSNSARVAAFGSVEVKEHKAIPKTVGSSGDVGSVYNSGEYADMLYELDLDDEVGSNTYDVMMPGVDIPKDPFVRVTTGEVDCELYIKVVEKNIPEEYQDRKGETHNIVTYTVDPSIWQKLPDDQQDGDGVIYKYSSVIDANSAEQKIFILEDNKICISQYYDADGHYNAKAPKSDDFSLTFSAWLVQVD